MGDLDALSREFAREHSERLWKQLVVAPDSAEGGAGRRQGGPLAVALAVAAAVAIKVPELFGVRMDPNQELPRFYIRNLSLFVLPFLAGVLRLEAAPRARGPDCGWRRRSRPGPSR